MHSHYLSVSVNVSVKITERHFINKSCTVGGGGGGGVYIYMFIKTGSQLVLTPRFHTDVATQHSSIFVYHTQAKKIGLTIKYCNVLILPWNDQLFAKLFK